MHDKVIKITKGVHKEVDVVFIRFPWNEELVGAVRTIEGAKWSQSNKSWYVLADEFNLSAVFDAFKRMAWVDIEDLKSASSAKKSEIKPINQPIKRDDTFDFPRAKSLTKGKDPLLDENKDLLQRFRKWLEHKRYSENSVRTYTEMLGIFARHMQPKPLAEVTNEDVIVFVHTFLVGEGYSFTYQNQLVSSLKLFFREIVQAPLDIERLERPRREHKLPNVLSKEEVKRIIDAHTNIKHRAMLSLIYACGLRRSELLNLRPQSIDSKRGLLMVRQAKGRKDRVVPLSDKTLEMLRMYYKMYKPT
jgi:integrase/recombinase XerD